MRKMSFSTQHCTIVTSQYFSPTHIPCIIADTRQLPGPFLLEGSDQVLRDTAQTEPSHQQLGAIGYVLHTGLGIFIEHCTAGGAGGEGPLWLWAWWGCGMSGGLMGCKLVLALTWCLVDRFSMILQFSFLRWDEI